jgi:hypothetical protein
MMDTREFLEREVIMFHIQAPILIVPPPKVDNLPTRSFTTAQVRQARGPSWKRAEAARHVRRARVH